MAKKTVKASAKKPAPGKAAKSAKAAPPAKQAAPDPQAAAPTKPKPPVVPPRPAPAHQQFLAKGGVKPQAMMKARIIRHQGR